MVETISRYCWHSSLYYAPWCPTVLLLLTDFVKWSYGKAVFWYYSNIVREKKVIADVSSRKYITTVLLWICLIKIILEGGTDRDILFLLLLLICHLRVYHCRSISNFLRGNKRWLLFKKRKEKRNLCPLALFQCQRWFSSVSFSSWPGW